MSVSHVNTLEVWARPGAAAHFEQDLMELTTRLGTLPGCLEYGLRRAQVDQQCWVLNGYWISLKAMVQHFSSVELDELLGFLRRHSASIRFSSISASAELEPHDGVR
ncbi:antibiotic biosynthesis monooxygenase [Pseudomonas resinovorans]|uniref:Antibiotic biosynthesis monooxygenase n=1 Tax=Metapseudomonas resinovorans TaxID=53412 RepID=A0ABT4Y343_METRE|nr:antibiotic biosynthesis monooxygenase [Pseudomonas resinovorans]MDA8483271.1 antibiotic biosynthesis monooxygenase [Pseudomonas resinovorans]